MTATIEVITKSRMAAFASCQRLHDLTYNLGYRSLAPREFADFGSLFHAGLDAWWGAHRDGGIGALSEALRAMELYRQSGAGAVDAAGLAKAQLLMTAYDARWSPSMADLEVLGVEVEFVATIPGRKRLRIAGKLDKLVRKRTDGSVWFVEHKTTGADLSAGSTYWQRLRMDPQVSIYFVGCRELGYDPHGCIYDVVDRPKQRPLSATPTDKRKYRKADGKLYEGQREVDETVEEFQRRLAGLITDNPDAYFARVEVTRLESEIEASLQDVTETALQIRAGSQTGVAPRNPAACHLFNRPCDFLSVCDGTESIDDETKFRKAETMHEELSLAK